MALLLGNVRLQINEFQDKYHNVIEPQDCGILTWLSFGAILQLLLLAGLPLRAAVALSTMWVALRMLKAFKDSRGIFRTSFTVVKRHRWTAEMPALETSKSTNDGLIIFVLGCRINQYGIAVSQRDVLLTILSPLGKFAPGNAEIGDIFNGMWSEAEVNRSK
jgi:hypothetical protein